jgi:hypothetical protein
MESDSQVVTTSAALVALSGWILPGGGYLLIGQRGRALVSGITIIVLFATGLLIGGIRVVEVPGYDSATGEPQMITVARVQVEDPATGEKRTESVKRWSLAAQPLATIADKPWSVPQALAGPTAIVSGALSLWAAHPAAGTAQPIGALSHARINELGSLYLSVAGLLNLMVIIDSAWRASQLSAASEKETA